MKNIGFQGFVFQWAADELVYLYVLTQITGLRGVATSDTHRFVHVHSAADFDFLSQPFLATCTCTCIQQKEGLECSRELVCPIDYFAQLGRETYPRSQEFPIEHTETETV